MNKNLKSSLNIINIILICLIILGIILTIFPLCFGHIGIAINGKIRDGAYFLGATGNYYKVSRLMFMISALGTLLAPICSAMVIPIHFLTSSDTKIPNKITFSLGVCFGLVVGGFFSLISLLVLLFAIFGMNYAD